jgi:aminoglycoside/choline kinase family phosphotransferase
VFDLYLKSPLTPSERDAHDRWADALCHEILRHPRALCHRDFHGNNLFPLDGEVAAIDFQDMRTGPDSYDIASLLWERTTLDWMSPELSDAMIAEFARRRGLDAGSLRRRFERVLLQRAWKVCGTFARAVSQGRGEVYRRYLPAEIALVGRLLGGSGEDRAFQRLWEARLRPLLS